MKKVKAFEPWFFLFFGLFHLHRVWALVDREAYADFWMGVMAEKGAFYYGLMGLLTVLCLLGIGVFFKLSCKKIGLFTGKTARKGTVSFG